MPMPARERQVGEVEVARAPAEQVRVERHDDRLAAGCLGATQQRRVELVGGRPVQLEQPRAARPSPRRPPPSGRRPGSTACTARRGMPPPGHRDVGVGVRHLHHPERREQERRGPTATEQARSRGRAPRRRAAGAATPASGRTRRGWPPSSRSAPAPPAMYANASARQRLACGALERVDVDRHRWARAPDARPVDLGLGGTTVSAVVVVGHRLAPSRSAGARCSIRSPRLTGTCEPA